MTQTNKTAEQPVPTREVNVGEFTICVPVGSMDEPTERVKSIVTAMYAKNWKMPTAPFATRDRSLADDVAYGLDWYLGGHEMAENNGEFTVTSLGYYHYVGA